MLSIVVAAAGSAAALSVVVRNIAETVKVIREIRALRHQPKHRH